MVKITTWNMFLRNVEEWTCQEVYGILLNWNDLFSIPFFGEMTSFKVLNKKKKTRLHFVSSYLSLFVSIYPSMSIWLCLISQCHPVCLISPCQIVCILPLYASTHNVSLLKTLWTSQWPYDSNYDQTDWLLFYNL